MPLYDIRCEETGKVFERHVKLSHFEEPVICACGSPGKRVISAPMFTVDRTGYDCPVTGKWVGSKQEHLENLKRTDSRVFEPGEKEAATARRAAEEAEFDRKIEDTVEREIEGYSSAKKEQLHNELVNGGLDIAVERQ